MFTEKEDTRQGLSARRIELHKQHGFNVRFNDDPPASDPPASDPPASDPPASDPPASDPNAGVFAIPDRYKDKPWAKDIDSIDAAFTKLDGAETLIGKKRTVIPDETTTPDQRAEFLESIGVPKDEATYESHNTPEGADNSFFDAMKPIFKKAGVTKDGAKILSADLPAILEKITGKKIADDATNDAEFDTMTTQVFGATKDTDLAQAKALLIAHTPACFAGHMDTVDNKTLTIVASALKNIRAKYMTEDGSALNGNTAVNSGADEVRKQAKAQIAIAQNPESTADQKEAAKKKANELYAQWEKMTEKK